MFLDLFLIFIVGIIGGYLFEKIKLPKLVFYIILGVLLGPSVFDILSDEINNLSATLRQIALVIILTRSGLSLDLSNLKRVGRPAILMCFIPACFEITGIVIFGPKLLNINIYEAMLLGSVIAAVSPAIVVPRMIKLIDEGYGRDKCVGELILASASVDDIFVIVLFYSFKGMALSNEFSLVCLYTIPLSIILGIILGIIVSIIILLIFKYFKFNSVLKTIIILGFSFLMIYVENVLKQYISISSLLGIIVLRIILLKYYDKAEVIKIKNNYNNMWSVFEILLFTLVGAKTNMFLAFSQTGGIMLGVILIGLIFRSLGTFVCLLFTKYNMLEKMFIIISYLPKATVQASIGAIALNEGLPCGDLVLIGAVISIIITAPLGAILIDNLYKRCLKIVK